METEKHRKDGTQMQESLYKTIFEGDLYYDVRLGNEDNYWIGSRDTVFFQLVDKSFMNWLWDALGEPTEEGGIWTEGDEHNNYWRWWEGVRITVERLEQ